MKLQTTLTLVEIHQFNGGGRRARRLAEAVSKYRVDVCSDVTDALFPHTVQLWS